MTKCVQAGARARMPGTSSNSAVPVAPAARPNRKAVPAAQTAARAQNSSPDHQYSASAPKVQKVRATGKATLIAWIGWPQMPTLVSVSS